MGWGRLITLVSVLSTLFCTARSQYPHHSHPNWFTAGPKPTSTTVPLPGSIETGLTDIGSTGTGSTGTGSSAAQTGTGTTVASSLTPTASSSPSTRGIVHGFNYDASVDFATEFVTAKGLVGTSGFTSARLYTMIEPGSTNTPISAIKAAIDTGTTLLLGLYCSQGEANFTHETEALASAISQYGSSFTDLIIGISVGSEDLYRNSVTTDGVGDTASDINKYISQTRAVLANASLDVMIGHVDTYGVWINSSLGGPEVLPNVDFVGVDAYPYWQNSTPGDANATFYLAIQQVQSAVGSKPVWITETGWPVTGPSEGPAVPSIENAQSYWQDVGCSLFGKMNTWYYTLNDAGLTGTAPSFGITGSPSDTCPLFLLTCPEISSSPSGSCTPGG